MAVTSAGILMYRIKNNAAEVLLLHPGGPYFKNKDKGVWSIPKGLPEEDENLAQAALREFEEETGIKITGTLMPLESIQQKGDKVVHAWALKGDLPEDFTLKCNFFELEWPPRSGKKQQFPEMDEARFFDIETAKEKINPAQILLITRLLERI